MSTSWSEPFSAWPMCSSPVTFGGGTQMTIGVVAARAGAGRVQALGLPRLLPARLDAARLRTADPSRESLGRRGRGARQLARCGAAAATGDSEVPLESRRIGAG